MNQERYRSELGLSSLIIPLIIAGCWWAANRLQLVRELFLPSPESVAKSIMTLLMPGSDFWLDLGATLSRFFSGFLIAVGLGVSLGMAMGYSSKVRGGLSLTVDILRSVPVSALFPLVLLLLGLGNNSKIALVVMGCAPIVLVDTMYAVRNASQTRKVAAKQMGARPLTIALRVVLMSALPQIIAGVRIAASLALVLVLVTEMWVGSNEGLGHRIMDTYSVYNTTETYATILIAGLLGWVINLTMVRFLDLKVTRWAGK